MKTPIKIFLPLIFLLLLLQPEAKAQDGWNFGLQGGLNIAWISTPEVNGDPLPGTFGTRTSYNVGLSAEYGFGHDMKQGGYYENSTINAFSQVVSFVVGVKGYLE